MNKVKLYIGGTAVLLFTLIIGSYTYITGTPEYALKQAIDSYKDKNKVAFESHVNIDNVLDLLVDDILSTALQDNVNKNTGGLETLGAALGMKMLESFKPQIKNLAKASLFEEFDENTSNSESKTSDDKKNLMKNFKGVGNLMNSVNSKEVELINIGDSTTSGNTSLISVNFKHKTFKKDFKIEIKLSRESGSWKVDEIRNIGQTLVDFNKWEVAHIEELNMPIIAEMKKALLVSTFKKKNKSDSWGISKTSSITLEIKNIADKAIESSSGTVHFKNSNGEILKKIPFNIKSTLKSNEVYGGTVKININSFIQSDNNFYKTNTKDLTTELKIQRITFKNGKKLELFDKVPNRVVANNK